MTLSVAQFIYLLMAISYISRGITEGDLDDVWMGFLYGTLSFCSH